MESLEPYITDEMINDPCRRMFVNCTCGIQRCLPAGIQKGQSFTLAPCPRCASPLFGTFVGDYIEVK